MKNKLKLLIYFYESGDTSEISAVNQPNWIKSIKKQKIWFKYNWENQTDFWFSSVYFFSLVKLSQ